MKIIKGGVTAAKGFEAASAAAGIKYQGRTDMALVYSQKPCEAAGTFTTNVVKAAPVKWDKKVVESSAKPQVIVINSGIANACTGETGMECCKEVAKEAAKALETETESVLIGSTGVIGMQLPVEKMKDGVHLLAKEKAEGLEMGNLAAKAIMTTDTKEKEAAVTIELDGTTVTIGGMAKGSGMIHPNMCTMLAFITTDAVISKEALQAALSSDVEETYNMISVDGDTSTNDTVLLLANQMAGNKEIQKGTKEFEIFKEALHEVNTTLAKKIAGDGEGATALLEVTVQGAETKQQAKTLAKSVICSNLTKTAIAGHDANWGRILCAMGYAGVEFEPEKTDLFIQSSAGELKLVENGMALDYSEEKATEILSQAEVCVVADIKAGTEKATAWGCDLTHGYIDINADYRS
ncbi:MAG: bifunctional glutamate N-acetyltransferase/amino-acid acetyltransferase ArgJ [Bacillota bacterium]|nr:bifunctional glutamate N-acetyltransferase/amino-acid acetyltransferase ArgJ [Bacillota bacterium]